MKKYITGGVFASQLLALLFIAALSGCDDDSKQAVIQAPPRRFTCSNRPLFMSATAPAIW